MSNSYNEPDFSFKINGSPASPELLEDIIQVVVEESLHLPSMFTVVVSNPYYSGRIKDTAWSLSSGNGAPSPQNKSGVGGVGASLDQLLKIGSEVNLGFTSSSTASSRDPIESESLFEGEITAVETHFTEDAQAPIVIRGYDKSHRLHRGRLNRTFQNLTDSDLVNQITNEVGIRAGTIQATSIVHEHIFQQNQTNMELIRERAARNGYDIYVRNGKFNFCKPNSEREIRLAWLTDISSFRVRANTAEQVQEVQVNGWDINKKSPISENVRSASIDLTNTGQGNGVKASQVFGRSTKLTIVDQPVFSSDEAKTMAQSIFDEISGEFIQADATGTGNPDIRAGRVVNIATISSDSGEDQAARTLGPYAGKYFITECRHLYQRGVYTTDFSVRGSRGGNLLSVLAPQNNLNPSHTFLVGIVTNIEDPQGLRRVKVTFPTLTNEHESNWARVVTLGAGSSRGMDWLPEVNDEVMVAFEHGDIQRPYVIGSVWNGKDLPAQNQAVLQGKVNIRTLQTRVGHKIQFVEETSGSAQKGILIETMGGHKIDISDGEKSIQIKSSSGHLISLDDQGSSVTITSTSGHKLEFSPAGVTLSSAGNLTIKAAGNIDISAGMNMDIKATAMVGVKGSMINLN
ncbi:MAG: VgrG-related protein [Cyanophyceae cyanobacterium]